MYNFRQKVGYDLIFIKTSNLPNFSQIRNKGFFLDWRGIVFFDVLKITFQLPPDLLSVTKKTLMIYLFLCSGL